MIAILAGFSLGLLVLAVLVRLYARRAAGRARSDDCAFYAGVLCGAGEVCVTLAMVGGGLGKSVGVFAGGEVERGVLAATVLYVLSLGASKVSCALMFVWLTPFVAQQRAAWGLVAASAVWMVSAVFLVGFGCKDVLGRCRGARTRWVYISVLDMLLEVALVGASVYMVWGRSMSARAKGTVMSAFACRLPYVFLKK